MARYGQTGGGGGFLAGAMQTAVGVAGGVVLGNMITDMIGGNKAGAAQAGRRDRALGQRPFGARRLTAKPEIGRSDSSPRSLRVS